MFDADFVINRGRLFHSDCATGSLSDLNLELGSGHLVNAADARALDAFLGGVERRAFRIAEIATRSRDDALDIVQDAMLQLARSYGHRPAAEWAPLFHRILENKICDWQRRQTVRRRLFMTPTTREADGDAESFLASIPDPSAVDAAEGLKQAQAMAALRIALPALPARQREAFVLRVWEGLSVEETARVMGCSDGSVKTHLSRALRVLKNKLIGVWP